MNHNLVSTPKYVQVDKTFNPNNCSTIKITSDRYPTITVTVEQAEALAEMLQRAVEHLRDQEIEFQGRWGSNR